MWSKLRYSTDRTFYDITLASKGFMFYVSSFFCSHKAGIGQLYQISQEDCGAITLTIPSASLEGEDLESDAALCTGNRNEVNIERVSLVET